MNISTVNSEPSLFLYQSKQNFLNTVNNTIIKNLPVFDSGINIQDVIKVIKSQEALKPSGSDTDKVNFELQLKMNIMLLEKLLNDNNPAFPDTSGAQEANFEMQLNMNNTLLNNLMSDNNNSFSGFNNLIIPFVNYNSSMLYQYFTNKIDLKSILNGSNLLDLLI